MRGRVIGYDSEHYHARVNNREVFRVQWDNGNNGSGWLVDDLVVL